MRHRARGPGDARRHHRRAHPAHPAHLRNAFGGAYASFNNYPTGADAVLALPTTRLAVMGPAGKEFVYKDELRPPAREAAKLEAATGAGRAPGSRPEGGRALRPLRARAHEPPKEALSLGSISRLVMPGELRRELGETLHFLMRHYTPSAMGGRAARVSLMSASVDALTGTPQPPGPPRPPPRDRARRPWVRSFACEELAGAHRLPRPHPQGGHGRLRGDGHHPRWASCSPRRTPSSTPRPSRPSSDASRTERVHRVQRLHRRHQGRARQRIHEIIEICQAPTATLRLRGLRLHGRGDEDFVRGLETAGLTFMGPCATPNGRGQEGRGQAHRPAERVSVTPGVDDVTTRALLRKHPTSPPSRVVAAHGLAVSRGLAEGAPRRRADACSRQLRRSASTSSPSTSWAPRSRR
jgi:hypothetical protein